MTALLALCQDVCKEIGILAPSTIVGNGETTALRLLALANREGKLIARKKPFTVLQKEHTFSTVNGTASYVLPSDYDRLLNDTAWDRSNYWEARGPLNPQQWQAVKSGLLQSPQLRKRWRVKADSGTRKFFIDPTPDAADSMVFEYVSSHWCQDSGGTGQTEFAADTDTLIIDETIWQLGLVWRMKKSFGFDYADDRDDADDARNTYWAEDGGAPTLSVSNPNIRLPLGNVPETGFGT